MGGMRGLDRTIVGAGLAVTLLVSATAARANGRYPAANQLVEDPSDPSHIVVRATYGILETIDGGASWSWICEPAVGYTGNEDPALGVTADGSLLVGFFDGLAASHDRGCTWSLAEGPLGGQYVTDLAVDRADPSHAVLVTSTGKPGDGGAPTYEGLVAETLDDGATWHTLGAGLPSEFLALTIETAKSDPDRVYVSGKLFPSQAGAIERSDDRGATFTELALDLNGGTGAYIAAVDPDDRDTVYLRVQNPAGDELRVSKDGAVTWTTIYTTAPYANVGGLLGFALSPDGAAVAIGGPNEGILVAPTSSYAFAKQSDVYTQCLTWTGAGLYACGIDGKDGFSVGLSHDEGKTFTPLEHLGGACPLACPPSSPVAQRCTLEALDQIAAVPAACGGGPADGGSGAGGGAGSSGSAPDSSGGCGCRAAGAETPGFAAAVALAVLALVRRRRLRA